MQSLGKRGDAGGTFFWVLETILALIVLLTIGFIVVDMVKNNAFTQNFFAKDNAHIIEALYGVPNGEMHIGYLWNTKQYSLTTDNTGGKVSVSKIEYDNDGKPAPGTSKTKSFGSSEDTLVDEKTFIPNFFEYVKKTTPTSKINVIEKFNELVCPDSQATLNGLKTSSSEDGFTGAAQPLLDDLLAAIRVERRSAGEQFNDNGPTLHFRIEQTYDGDSRVYFKGTDSQVMRLACLIASKLSTTDHNVPYVGDIPDEYKTMQEQIIVVIRVPSQTQLPDMQEKVKQGIRAYWGGNA